MEDPNKKILEDAVIKSLNLAFIEFNKTKKYFSEEALRYIVIQEISKKKLWGTFPNNSKKNTHLIFEFPYNKFKKIIGHYKPDITSLRFDSNGNIHTINPLAIELKITKNNSTKDINKCREYIHPNKGKYLFELAAFIIVTNKNIDYEIKQLVNRQNKKRINEDDKKILLGYLDTSDDNPSAKLLWIW